MSIVSGPPVATSEESAAVVLPPLAMGDHLDQPTFHARYAAMPRGTRAELIEGIVYMPSPTGPRHSLTHARIGRWLAPFEASSPGVEVHVNATFYLGRKTEVQPDVAMLLLPEYGGQVRVDQFFRGGPELAVEAALTTESYDLHTKLRAYRKANVREYVVVALWQSEVFWFVNRGGKFERLPPGTDGILRSEFFPGLWLDPAALLAGDIKRVEEVARRGLESAEHKAWARRLKAIKRPEK